MNSTFHWNSSTCSDLDDEQLGNSSMASNSVRFPRGHVCRRKGWTFLQYFQPGSDHGSSLKEASLYVETKKTWIQGFDKVLSQPDDESTAHNTTSGSKANFWQMLADRIQMMKLQRKHSKISFIHRKSK